MSAWDPERLGLRPFRLLLAWFVSALAPLIAAVAAWITTAALEKRRLPFA